MRIKKIIRHLKMLFVSHDKQIILERDGFNENEIIRVNGKQYIKVKLRFVDSLEFRASEHIENLETETEAQRHEILRLFSLNENLEQRIKDLQNLNVNFHHELKHLNANHQKEIQQLSEEINHKRDAIIYFDKQLTAEKNKSGTFQHQLKISNQENKLLRTEVVSLNASINDKDSLFSKITQLHKTVENLNAKISQLRRDISVSENVISEKNALINTLTNKLFNKNSD